MAFIVPFLLMVCLYTSVIHAQSNDANFFIKAVCSESKPLVYEEGGVIKGPGYDIATQVLEHAGIPYSYEMQPWARVYQGGLTEKNFLVSCLGRTPKREHLFHWIGPITRKVEVAIYKMATNPLSINHLEQAKQYRIGVLRGTYSQDFLEASDFNKNNIYLTTEPDQLFKMLVKKRYDLIIVNDFSITTLAKKLNINPAAFEKVIFAFSVTENLAFGKNTAPELVKKLRASYQALEAAGAFKKLLK